MQHQNNLQNILCSDAHEGGKTQNPRWRHVYVEIQDGRYFSKIVYVITDPQVYRSFESIKHIHRFDFLKIFVIPGGNAPPKNPPGGFFGHPSRSKEHPPPLLHAV